MLKYYNILECVIARAGRAPKLRTSFAYLAVGIDLSAGLCTVVSQISMIRCDLFITRGVFALLQGHAECLSYMRAFGVPMLVLGGGGYKISNVARCWAYETGCLLGKPPALSRDIQQHDIC